MNELVVEDVPEGTAQRKRRGGGRPPKTVPFEGRAVVYQYGCPSKVEISDVAMAQLRQANRLWNDLVEIQKKHEAEVAALWAAHPEVADATARLEEADVAAEEARAAIKDARQAERSRTVPRELLVRAKEAGASLKERKLALKTVKAVFYDVTKPAFVELGERTQAAKKALYATHSQEAGLYWATYNAVVQSFETSLRRLHSKRAAGEPSELHFHPFTGEGTWTVQLARRAGDPARTWSALTGGASQWRNVVRPGDTNADEWDGFTRAERRREARTTIAIRVGTTEAHEPEWLTIPVSIHRPVPADADVTQVQITRRRVGTHYRHSVAVTCRLPAVAPVERKGLVALDLGWRRREDGSLRVGVWRGLAPISDVAVPGWMEEWIRVGDHGRSGEVVVPKGWLEEMSRLDGVASLADTKRNALQGEMVKWLKERPDAAEALGVTPAELVHWKSAGRLARLVLRWRQTRLAGDEDIFTRAEAWRRQDRHLVEWESQGRDQLIAVRREVYRVLAARLVAAYGCFVAEDMAIPKLTRKGKPEDGPDYMEEAARKSAKYAAPGSLRAAIKLAAGREGVSAMEVPSMGTTKVHARCDTWLDHDFSEQIMAWCPKCEMGFDQDANACENLLRLASGEVVELSRDGARRGGVSESGREVV
ncbi:MAG: hypothetical protein ACYCZN_01375 [Candidatus Dormibacteria bacterium]